MGTTHSLSRWTGGREAVRIGKAQDGTGGAAAGQAAGDGGGDAVIEEAVEDGLTGCARPSPPPGRTPSAVRFSARVHASGDDAGVATSPAGRTLVNQASVAACCVGPPVGTQPNKNPRTGCGGGASVAPVAVACSLAREGKGAGRRGEVGGGGASKLRGLRRVLGGGVGSKRAGVAVHGAATAAGEAGRTSGSAGVEQSSSRACARWRGVRRASWGRRPSVGAARAGRTPPPPLMAVQRCGLRSPPPSRSARVGG